MNRLNYIVKRPHHHFRVDLFLADQVESNVGENKYTLLRHAVTIILFTLKSDIDGFVPLLLEHVVTDIVGNDVLIGFFGVHLNEL